MGYLFVRDKVQISLQLPKYYYLPGEMVTGTLQLEVLSKLEITAVRIGLQGKETSSIKVGRNRHKGEFIHFEKLITCFGHSKVSGRKTGAELDVGTYVYPFRFQLPPGTPPSYHCKIDKSAASLVYVLKASVVIPGSLDADRKWVVIVRATAPMQQVLDRLQVAKRLEGRVLHITKGAGIGSGNCCCGGGGSKNPVLTVTATVGPNIVVVGNTNPPTTKGAPTPQNLQLDQTLDEDISADPQGDQDEHCYFGYTSDTTLPTLPPQILPNVVSVDLQLRLEGRKSKIQKVQVLLTEVRTLRAGTNSTAATTVLAEQTLNFNGGACLQGGMEKRIPVHLNLRPQMSSFKGADALIAQFNANRPNEDNKKMALPMPTMSTKLVETTVCLEVRFPGVEAIETCSVSNVLNLVGAVDPLNQLPPVPVRYNQAVLLPEDEFLDV